MKKLNLKLQDLAVESFPTQEPVAILGTVRANHSHVNLCETDYPWFCTQAAVSCDYGCNTNDDGTCPTGGSCQESCGGTCGDTCQTCPDPTSVSCPSCLTCAC